jgi:hypothetical protein
VKELDSNWRDVIYSITKGDPGAMMEIVKFDVFEFFAYIDNNIKYKK